MIHNVFNEDLLTQCRELQLKEQYIELALLLNIINEKEGYKVEKVQDHRKQEQSMQFLVYWKEYENEHD